ncbi:MULTISPECIES: phage tail tube protein [Rhodomicrobium]|uniref:phage tail tube protein n=1 Tax=Rhodomicrobium TaxID=1068 RepID=UPI000B4B97F0|nr:MULTISPECIES: phage tail tube protein [Rhodomicrobium]
MTANVGRTTMLHWGEGSPAPVVAGVREKGITFSGEAVDITNDDSSGWQQLLNAAQVKSVEITCSGVLVNDTLRADYFGNARMKTAAFEYPDGGVVTGSFYLQEYAETGNHDDAITFEATFVSSGAVAYTPAD